MHKVLSSFNQSQHSNIIFAIVQSTVSGFLKDSKTTVGVKNLLRWGSNRRPLVYKADVFTIPPRKTYILRSINAAWFSSYVSISDIMQTGRTWVQFSVAPKSLCNWDDKKELARYYWKAKQRPKTSRSIPNLLAIKFSEKHILRIINYHSLLWYQITLEKQQFQLQSMQSWTQHADIT